MAGESLTAEAVNTIDWIRRVKSITVPVYQRDYRWTWESCQRLLADVEAVALPDSSDGTHFIGSILTVGQDVVTLVDGQQRLITLFLLLMAIKDAARREEDPLAEAVGELLVEMHGSGLRLRAHPNQIDILQQLISHGPNTVDPSRGGALLDNYNEFARAIAGTWRHVSVGLNRLENVVICLREKANAQQVFESLNSTGESLVNHELMHNYVLMGLTYEQQLEVQRDIWSKIEAATTSTDTACRS